METSAGGRRSSPARFFTCCLFAILAGFGAVSLRAAEAVVYQVNDRIESNLSVFGWQKGTVVEVGQGDKAGQVKILTDGYAAPGWVGIAAMKFVRKIPGAAPAVPTFDANQPPRLGKYNILSYGPGGKNLFLGHVELLAGGKYRVSRTAEGNYFGEGKYSYDVASKKVQWLSGPYQEEADWGGGFEISREGKTHAIRLRRGTLATNSTE
ncbi:MAG TPA: hypothetical protein VHO24_09195 [Opitutaceae bacterium]|nr:hypothetical protein [Opitutaceae bacterium]